MMLVDDELLIVLICDIGMFSIHLKIAAIIKGISEM